MTVLCYYWMLQYDFFFTFYWYSEQSWILQLYYFFLTAKMCDFNMWLWLGKGLLGPIWNFMSISKCSHITQENTYNRFKRRWKCYSGPENGLNPKRWYESDRRVRHSKATHLGHCVWFMSASGQILVFDFMWKSAGFISTFISCPSLLLQPLCVFLVFMFETCIFV